MALVCQINENGWDGLILCGSAASRSVLISKYSGDIITNSKLYEANVMDMRQETEYVILVGKCEGKRQPGRPSCRQEDNLRLDL